MTINGANQRHVCAVGSQIATEQSIPARDQQMGLWERRAHNIRAVARGRGVGHCEPRSV